MRLWWTMKQPSWQQITDQRTKKRQRHRPHICATEDKTTGARSGYECCTLETLEGETLLEYNNTGNYMSNIMQAPLEVFWERWVQPDNDIQRMQLAGPPYPNRRRCSRMNLIGLVKKESKTGAYRCRYDGYRDTPGWCYTLHLHTINGSVCITKSWSCYGKNTT